MGLFTNYDNLNPNYIPDNISKKCNLTESIDYNLPYVLNNIKGNQIGYGWHLGDIFRWDISLDKTIAVEFDAIILEEHNQTPDAETIGYTGQMCYNIVDLKAWECTKINDDYVWEEFETFSYPLYGDKDITLKPYINGTLKLTLYDNWWNVVKEINSNQLNVDAELNDKLTEGIYYLLIKDDIRTFIRYMICIE